MKVTFIIRNLTEDIIGDLGEMSADDRYERLHRWAFGSLKHCVSVKFGTSNAFRDRLSFNTERKAGKQFVASSVETRRGYKLAIFEI